MINFYATIVRAGMLLQRLTVDAAHALMGYAHTGTLCVKCERRCGDSIFADCFGWWSVIWKHPDEPAHCTCSSLHAAQFTSHSMLQCVQAGACSGRGPVGGPTVAATWPGMPCNFSIFKLHFWCRVLKAQKPALSIVGIRGYCKQKLASMGIYTITTTAK